MDLSKNLQLDLLYLTNDRIRSKVRNLENGVNKEDLKFYRKRILQQTKNYLREGRLESSIDSFKLTLKGFLYFIGISIIFKLFVKSLSLRFVTLSTCNLIPIFLN